MKRLLIFLVLLYPSSVLAAVAETRCVSVVPTLDTAAYATGDVMSSTAMTFANVLNPSRSRTGYIISATISDAGAQPFDVDLVLLSTLPAAGTFGATNAAFDPTDAQILTLLGAINFGSATRFAFSDNALKFIGTLAIPVRSVAATPGNIYGVLVARGDFDAVAADDLQVTLCVLQD